MQGRTASGSLDDVGEDGYAEEEAAISLSKLDESKTAIRRLSAEDRTQLIVWLAHGMPKDEGTKEIEEVSGIDTEKKTGIWKKV